MKSHVIFQLLFLAEDDMTDWTSFSLLPGVCSLVGVAGTFVTEHHVTKLALVRLYAQVDSQVSF